MFTFCESLSYFLCQHAEVQLRAVACVGNLLENIPASAIGASDAAGEVLVSRQCRKVKKKEENSK